MLPTEPGLVGRAGKQHWGVSWAAGPPDLPEVPIYACQRIKIVNPHCSRNTAVVRSGLAGEQPRLALLLNSETWKSLGSDTGQVCERLLSHGMSGSRPHSRCSCHQESSSDDSIRRKFQQLYKIIPLAPTFQPIEPSSLAPRAA